MHRFVLLNFLFEFLSENIALMDDDIRGSIAVRLLQLAMVFEFLKFLLKNFQTGFQLSVEKRKCFDLLGIPSEILIFSIVVVLEKINDLRPATVTFYLKLLTFALFIDHRLLQDRHLSSDFRELTG